MRHGVAGKKFGRNQKLRQATVRDLAKAVLIQQIIRTTRVKAGEARKLVDKLITLGKTNTLAAKRRAFAVLCDHALVSDLFTTIAPRFASRQGGYTRIIKLAVNRQGDNAEMALLELTERTAQPVTTGEPKADAKTEGVKGGAKAEEAEVVAEEKTARRPARKKTPVKDEKEQKDKKAGKSKKSTTKG